MIKRKFLEQLKLQLFAATNDDPDFSEQDDEISAYDEEEDIAIDEENSEEEIETEEPIDTDDEENENDEPNADSEEDKPFMVFKSKEEHQKYMDNIIGNRLKDHRETKSKLDEYENVVGVLKDYFQVDDFEALKKKSDELLEDIAYQRGITKEQLLKQQKEQQELRELRALKENQERLIFENAFNADCQRLAKINPELYGDIEADKLIQNTQFLQMLGSGVPFKQAYDALHVEELIKKQTAKAKKNVIDDVKASGTRIRENAGKRSKAGITKIDVNNLSDEQLAEIEARAARGERVTF